MFGRFRCNDDVFYGEVSGNTVISQEGAVIEYKLSELEVLPPSHPSKIVCVGLNYHDHATELGLSVPEEPILFIKPPSAVIGQYGKILYPKVSKRVDFEAELAIIIGKRCKNITYDRAYDVIAGFTCINDVTARDLQQKDGQWTRAKSFDTFAPVGPFIVPVEDFNPEDASIVSRVNGEVKQDSNICNLIFDVPYLIEFISGIMTLEVGDVIATGTPPGVGELHPGDVVEVEIEGIGTLTNEVV
ncbi:fumarylacetoacetate hydrolase family protein [Methanolobus mangrovi]|uniref:Fumarylacetoacetate hydrolase family protein n=1 Tax=Methanolobus mangrovi TaxID=3072977 RepID=A0AA51UFT6_9EURY|nr:fumarylacetoacetate hydrolase family protein [Methanolobus mangrovi]WMW22393.1 fumarylacetoacetate hydrolase family protein [Methanolobus mangrovi]